MIEVKVYNDIDSKKSGMWMSMFGIDDTVFSADVVRSLFDNNKDEEEFKFNIHCDGGLTSEGFAIYDIIRNSGKTIYTNIDGACHSMAVTLLLAAPFENRTANRNSRALIHQVYAAPGYLNADDARKLADELEDEQNAILDIYEDRTGTDRQVLENLMKEEKQRTAQELLDYGFIAKINNYNTNKNFNKMAKGTAKQGKPSLQSRVNSFLNKAKKLLNTATYNYDFTDENGDILFSTEGEDSTLEVGMAASPDGTYTVGGQVIVVLDGIITEITDPESEDTEVENLKSSLEEAYNIINELRNQIQSTHNVAGRRGVTSGKQESVTDYKNTVRENLKKARGGK